LVQCLASTANELPHYQLVGDWRVYLELLKLKDASVAYVADSLNIHRRHGKSVTQTLDVQQHFDEVSAMHRHARATMQIDDRTQELMDVYLDEIAVHLESERVTDKAA